MADLSAKLNTPTSFPVNLSADLTMTETHTEPVYGDVYGQIVGESTPFYIGTAVAGGKVVTSGIDLNNQAIDLFILPKTDKFLEGDLNFNSAVQTRFAPNTETLTPVLWATAPATNTQIFFGIGNFSPSAKYRHIQWSLASDFSSPTDIFHNIANAPNTQLDAEVSITRNTNLTNAETRYIRVRHSSNGDVYGDWSTPSNFNVTFANSGGTGGSGDNPKPYCFAERTIFHLIDEEITFADLYRRFENGILRQHRALSFDENGNQVEGEITAVFRTLKNKWLLVEFDDGERFEVTGGHKFFTNDGYIAIRDLQIGAEVVNADGSVSILTSKKEMTGSKYFYNASIKTFMNYCVGKRKIRVHNLKEVIE